MHGVIKKYSLLKDLIKIM